MRQLVVFIGLIMCACVQNSDLNDPIWKIHPFASKLKVLKELQTNKDIERYAFSYQTKVMLEMEGVDVALFCWATQPHVTGSDSTILWRYTISPQFPVNVDHTVFNVDLYEKLKVQWMNSFGDSLSVFDHEQAIVLLWDLSNNISIEVTVNKMLNTYLVEYKQKKSNLIAG